MSCDAGVCIYSHGIATQSDGAIDASYGIMISDITSEPGWVRCAGGDSPLVKISKDPGSDRYRVLVTCSAKSDGGPPH